MIIKTEQNEIQDYLKDASNTNGYCEAVIYPENTDEVISILKRANSEKTKITVCGNRTGLSGGSVPNGGIVLSTEKMNRILEINEEEQFAIVEPGVLLSDFLKELKPRKLYYPPDPTELNCFLGGTVATNASGSKTFKYGPTRDFVIGIEIVLASGDLLVLDRGKYFAKNFDLSITTADQKRIELKIPSVKSLPTKNTAGYFCRENMDVIDLFIGSEGTLGILTKLKLKLLPAPQMVLSAVIFFNSEDDGLNFIEESRNESFNSRINKSSISIDALALEYFDKYALDFLRQDFPNIPEDANSAVWFEQEMDEESSNSITDLWINLIEKHNGDLSHSWIAMNEKDKLKFIEFRHRISTKVNEFISSRNMRKLGTDFAVPDEELKKFYFKLKNDVEKTGLDYVIYGHFGNSHIHLNMLPKNAEEFETAKKLYDNMCLSAIKSGGTFAAEHGVGKNKKALLYEMYDEKVMSEMWKIKQTLDPNLILCCGNIFKTES
ncbi:MAG: FAD-binding oxidoreductase [Ignavibacteriaceae bacterium]|jgi:D-lactate dehydrogenase (cytochrome)|nr:FAD-binding oxidoreductase [Ignavibacteriaceae bacterium]